MALLFSYFPHADYAIAVDIVIRDYAISIIYL
jgi:hypothetical protein